jgi:hypothetical protein
MSFSKNIPLVIALSLVVVGFSGYSFIKAAYDQSVWFPPAGTPPGNNVIAPLNHGTSTESMQIGNGNLGFDQLTAFSQTNSDNYCDLQGGNCFKSTDVGAANLSVIHTYSTINNIRNVSGASCSCSAGDFLTACNGNGTPLTSSDQNACSGATACTCLSTVAAVPLCSVALHAVVKAGSYNTVVVDKTLTIQVNEGTVLNLGAWAIGGQDYWYSPYTPAPDVHFTSTVGQYIQEPNGMFVNPPTFPGFHSGTFLGYWTAADYATYHTAFDALQWKASKSFTVKSGMAAVTTSITNTFDPKTQYPSQVMTGDQPPVPNNGTITATVSNCQG